MQIVIDIPEETYEYWKEHCYEYVLSAALKNGTPLPKGHGDLIDRDKIKCSNCGKFGCENSDICSIYHAQTIIEADRW